MAKNKHIGSSFDDFLKEEGRFEEAERTAVKRVLAWQIEQAMKEQHITKQKMAELMNTSRIQVDRLLDPDHHTVQLDTLQKAAVAVNRKLVISLEPVPA